MLSNNQIRSFLYNQMSRKESRVNEPAYIRLYKKLRDDIVEGVYPHGSRLPSKRLLSEETGLSAVTVEHAYELLCDEGYAFARERSGYFAAFSPSDGFAAAPDHVKRPAIVKPAEERPEFPFSVWSKTVRRILSDYGEAALDKTENKGSPELRRAISLYLARNRDIRADAEQIVIGSGAEHIYGLLTEFLGRGRAYAIESPSYEKIEQVYRAEDAHIELLPLCRDGIDSAALAACKADVLHTTPYRSYPSGVTATASKRHEYLRWAQREGRLIIEDDFESEFSLASKPGETLFAMSKKENVIYLNTFSKTISPSLRVGYFVLPPSLTRAFDEKCGFYSCTVSTFEQLILTELINSGDFERHINRVRRAMRKGDPGIGVI